MSKLRNSNALIKPKLPIKSTAILHFLRCLNRSLKKPNNILVYFLALTLKKNIGHMALCICQALNKYYFAGHN